MDENRNDINEFDCSKEQPEATPNENTTGYQPYSYTPNSVYGQYNSYEPKKPQKKNGGGSLAIILCIVLSVLISTGASVIIILSVLKNDNDTASSNLPTSSQTTSTDANSENTNSTVISIEGSVMPLVETVYEKAGNSVVGIRATTSVQGFFGGSQESSSDGSGVIYTADGYIITNYHVIEKVVKSNSKTSIIEVYLNSDPDTAIDATVVGYNMSADLAVIKVDKKGLVPVDIGDSDEIKVGQSAIAIGCPGGLEFMGSVSYGIISGLNRTITIDAIGDMELIQTDAAINPGNSGGALLNSKGELIGINSSKLIDTSFEGMGFAIPSNTVINVVKKIMDNKDKPSPYIGIEIYTYSSSYLEKYNLPHGAAVKSVVSGGPAASAGIRAGDIITQFNSVDVDEYTDFIDALEDCTPGTKVTAKIYRNGRNYTTTVTIGSNNSR